MYSYLCYTVPTLTNGTTKKCIWGGNPSPFLSLYKTYEIAGQLYNGGGKKQKRKHDTENLGLVFFS